MENLKEYEFISKAIIEAENEQDAKYKFADNSIDFAANATCSEVLPIIPKSYAEQVDNLLETIIDELKNLVRLHARADSGHTSDKVLHIEDEELNFNLNNSKYLTELTLLFFMDQEGYQYSYYVLDIQQLAELCDYFTEKFKT